MTAKYWLYRVAANWLVIAAALYACQWWALIPLAVVVVGTRQLALGVLGHDAVHRNGAGDVLANLLVWFPLTMDVAPVRQFHFAHHRHLNGKKDPEQHIWAAFPRRWAADVNKPRRLLADLCGLGLTEIWVTRQTMMKSHPTSLAPVLFQIGFILTLGWLALVWYVAFGTVFFAVLRARSWEEHHGSDGTHQQLWEPALWRRLLYLPERTWKHYEHHASPATPVWML